MSVPGRNDPCPCGSGRKYKQCCLPREQTSPRSEAQALPALMQSATELYRSGRLVEAEAMFRRVATSAPQHADACFRLGHLCNRQGRLAEAVDWLRKALERNPRHARAYNTLGMALDGLGQSDEAQTCYRHALRLDPGNYAAQFNLGAALLAGGSVDEAVMWLEKASVLQPGHGPAQLSLGLAHLRRGDLARAMTHLGHAVRLSPDLDIAHDAYLFALNYLPISPAAVYQAHRDYAERFESPLKPGWRAHRNDRDPARRLKLGYVSPDFRQHAVAMFLEPILARHDKRQFEIHGYFNGDREDAVTRRLREHIDQWLPCHDLTDAQLAERIVRDGIDILVDLAGHTTDNRLPVFARKPAPVQVTWLGYPATTGLDAIDYRIVTTETDPPGAEAWHSERLWRLPGSLWCYRPNPDMPPVVAETAAHRRGYIRFVSANNIAKLSDATIATWSRLLEAVPGSTLIISNVAAGETRRMIVERFARRGIGAARIELYGKLTAGEFFSLLNEADIALDPWPYNGTTTSCESLWMGLPLVSLIGEASAARSGHALLATIGLEELAARDEAEYVRIAAALARDLPRLERMRASMRERIEDSPLRDEAGFTRNLESAYRAMWEDWCRSTGVRVE